MADHDATSAPQASDAATDAFTSIAALCGCPTWSYPGQVVRDVERLKKERDDAVALRNVAEAQRDEALEALRSDGAGLAIALDRVVKAIESRTWLLESRGPYEWDDDRYREEAGLAMREAIGIAREALKESGKRLRNAVPEARFVVERMRVERDDARADARRVRGLAAAYLAAFDAEPKPPEAWTLRCNEERANLRAAIAPEPKP